MGVVKNTTVLVDHEVPDTSEAPNPHSPRHIQWTNLNSVNRWTKYATAIQEPGCESMCGFAGLVG